MKTKIIALFLCAAALLVFASCSETELSQCTHEYKEEVLSLPDCWNVGKTKYTCVRCGRVYYDQTFAEHTFLDGVCTRCGDSESEFSPVFGGHYTLGPTDAPVFVPDPSIIESYELTGVGNNSGSAYHVPEMHDGKPVSSIVRGAFEGRVFDTIYLQHSLQNLSSNAFDGVTASDGGAPTFILDDPEGAGLFIVRQNCLIRAYNDDIKKSGAGESVYAELYALLPGWTMIDDGSIRAIGDNLFNGATIGSFTVPEGVVEIGNNAFANCARLTEVHLPDGLKTIASGAFSGDGMLKDVEFPDSLEIIGSVAFKDCTSLSKLVFGASLSEIGDSAFINCTGIKTIEAESFLRVINFGAFKNNTSLKSLKLKKGVNYLESDAFRGCLELEELYIGTLGKGYYWEAFQECTKLHKITLSKDAESLYMWHFLGTDIKEIAGGGDVLTVEDGRVIDKKKGILYAVVGDCTDPLAGVKQIVTGAFSQSTVKKLTIPGDVIIEDNAFVNAKLEEVTVEEGVTELPSMAFQTCKELRSVVLPASLRTVHHGAFQFCSSLHDLVIPMGVEKLETCFTGCTSLHTLTLPSTLTSFDKALRGHGIVVPVGTIYYLGTEEQYRSTGLDIAIRNSFGNDVVVVFQH